MPDSGRRMQKLFPAAVPVSEKREVLSFLCQGFRMRTNRRLVAIHGSMRAFWGHPCPQILGVGRKLRTSGFSPKSQQQGKASASGWYWIAKRLV